MNKHSSLSRRASLLERAAELYDFDQRNHSPVDETTPPPVAAVAETIAGPEAFGAPEPVRARARKAPRPDEDLLIDPDGPVTGLAEEFRIIKRQLLLGTQGQAGKDEARHHTILVCSAQPDEGKTFAAVNLALSIAGEKDLEVLLVDADFANPQVPGLLGLEAGPGLTDALASPGVDPNSYVIRSSVSGLSVLPAGRPANDITELLASARTTQVLHALARSERRRILILDSPPVLVASPATVLAAYAGQIMLVVRADWTTDADLREALPLLSACENISLLLNRTRLSVSGRRFGSYYGLDQ
jgi:exopolysaccharide/PEP-CTERM locus tyrosine autokinase